MLISFHACLKAFAKSIQTSRSFSSLEIPSEDLHEALACQMHKLLALGLRKRVASESHRCVGLDWSGVSVEALQNNRSNFRTGPS